MYQTRHTLLVTFHGCDEQVRDELLLGKKMLRKSKNLWDWLGHGIYFWENNYIRAYEWAVELKKRGKIEKPSVVGAILSLGNCLDLSDAKFISQLSTGYENLKHISEVLPVNKNYYLRNLDCAVIEAVHRIRKEQALSSYDSVRSAFPEGNEVYPTAGFFDKNHIQICVRNPNCIKGFFLPRENDPQLPPV
jgi:hypothetical protein